MPRLFRSASSRNDFTSLINSLEGVDPRLIAVITNIYKSLGSYSRRTKFSEKIQAFCQTAKEYSTENIVKLNTIKKEIEEENTPYGV